ncbi:MAG: phosphatidylinositol-specific phospholipase C/glycerophosphodiester phosphodiesterase family protein [Planctomycetota bacterium]|nr:phosphatidylinositol-specific phospholipase C/glycerophosphodiester phosphodiesterase family protein [Planctomycetota bacterium]
MRALRLTPAVSSTLRPRACSCNRFAVLAVLAMAIGGCAVSSEDKSVTAGDAPLHHETPMRATARTNDLDAARRGHSHNDYTRSKPLIMALENGMGSVEADIFLVDGELLVGHDRKDLRKDRTLAAMYLDPLAARARERGGNIYGPDERPLILLIDIKADGPMAYEVLHEQLEVRAQTFTECVEGRIVPRAVTVIISGACPRSDIAAQPRRWAFVDGRVQDLLSDAAAAPPTTLVPLVSESWFSHFSWLGLGEMPADQSERLRELVNLTHARGYKIRFWGTPASDATWRAQLDAGVDLINMDQVARGAAFLRANLPSLGR